MKAEVFTSVVSATAATTKDDTRHFYGMNGRVVLAETLSEARSALTAGLKRMSQKDALLALAAEVRGEKDAGTTPVSTDEGNDAAA